MKVLVTGGVDYGSAATHHRRPSSITRSDIQGLRGFAVVIIVLYHTHLRMLAGGYIGVDIFFVISGYLITGLILEEILMTGGLNLTQFYARRIRRLLPALSVMLCAALLVTSLLYSPLERAGPALSGKAAALYAGNIWFARQATDYFGGSDVPDPLLHTWSLGVEEQFYLVWPALLLLTSLAGAARTTRRRLVGVVAAIAVASFAACLVTSSRNQPWAFFGPGTRAWEFSLGALARLFVPPVGKRMERFAAGSGIVGAAVMVFVRPCSRTIRNSPAG